MIASREHIYEIVIEEKYSNVFRRTFKSVRWVLLVMPIVFLFLGLLEGFSLLNLWAFLICIAVFYFVGFCENWKMMSKIVINHSSGEIDIFSFRGNKFCHELTAKSRDVEILVRQDFGYKITVWGIAFYHRKKRKFYQTELHDWRKNIFLEIENEWKKSKSQASSSSEI